MQLLFRLVLIFPGLGSHASSSRATKFDFTSEELYIRIEMTLHSFFDIINFVERIIIEHIELICSLESELSLMSICSIRTPSTNKANFKKKRLFQFQPIFLNRKNLTII